MLARNRGALGEGLKTADKTIVQKGHCDAEKGVMGRRS
jgi:hypothetical protein